MDGVGLAEGTQGHSQESMLNRRRTEPAMVPRPRTLVLLGDGSVGVSVSESDGYNVDVEGCGATVSACVGIVCAFICGECVANGVASWESNGVLFSFPNKLRKLVP